MTNQRYLYFEYLINEVCIFLHCILYEFVCKYNYLFREFVVALYAAVVLRDK